MTFLVAKDVVEMAPYGRVVEVDYNEVWKDLTVRYAGDSGCC